MSTESQLRELLGFLLLDQQPNVQCIALQHLVGYSPANSPHRSIFLSSCPRSVEGTQGTWLQYIAYLVTVPSFNIAGKHDAFKILINLCDDASHAKQILSTPHFLDRILESLSDKDYLLADTASMLLSNLSQFPEGQRQLLQHFPLLTDLFLANEHKHANLDFLSSVVANLSTLPDGRAALVSGSPGQDRLSQLAIYSEHPSVMRRGGVASTLKNVAFRVESHNHLLSPESNILPRVLLPLCGPEEFPIEELDQLPADLQLLPEDKQREKDKAIRGILLETLILLCTTKEGRQRLRDQNVYRVVQMMDLVEEDPHNKDLSIRLVGLLMRQEEGEPPLAPMPAVETAPRSTTEEDVVEEV